MTRTRTSASLALAAALAGSALSMTLATPIAHADPLDGVRGAVNGARAQSTCPALTYSGQLEAAAQDLARLPGDVIEHINPHGYQGTTSGGANRDDPTATATAGLVEQDGNNIHDCANKDFGVGMFRDAGANQSVVALVLGRPAQAPAPAAAPAQPPSFQQSGTVIGGDADVFNIAHNDVPDPANGVVGLKIGTLPNGSQVYLGSPCNNGWCRVNSNQIQSGYGFVEQGHLQIK
jgi:hypothetical protein